MTFRFILRDAIYSSQRRNNLGILEQPTRKLRRVKVYEEILQYSYHEYIEKFVIPYYGKHGVNLGAPGSLERASSLRTYAAGLRANPDIRLIVNRNDFLLPEEDLAWLKTTFAPDQLTIFDQGGHLGNLSHPAVQKAIMAALNGLQSVPPKPR